MKIRNLISFFTDFKMLKVFYSASHKGYLHDHGWIKSYQTRRSLDVDGNPVPSLNWSDGYV